MHGTQIRLGISTLLWSGIESRLKLLGADLSVFIQNVGIDVGDHIDLRMTGVALSGFQIAVVQL